MWVGVMKSAESLTRTEKLMLSQIRGSSSCLAAFQLELKHQAGAGFSFLQTLTETSALPGSPACPSRQNYTISSPGLSLAAAEWDLLASVIL